MGTVADISRFGGGKFFPNCSTFITKCEVGLERRETDFGKEEIAILKHSGKYNSIADQYRFLHP